MKELIKKLSESFGPAGCENNVRSLIIDELKQLNFEHYVDTLGSLIVTAGSNAKQKILITAHMDEIGLMVTFIDENGFLRFTNIGGVLTSTLPGTKVLFQNGTVGVIGQEKIKEPKELEISKLYIDLGARNRDEALEKINIGHTAVYLPTFHQEGNRITAKSLDDRIGCFVLLETLKRLPSSLPNQLFFAFTVQEEVGLRGAKTASYSLKPDYGLAVDVTRVGDTPEPDFKMVVSLGKGPAVKIKDSSVICHPKVVNLMIETAEKNQIPYQLEILEQGGTDAGAIHLSRDGVPSGVLSVPCRYIHTPAEMVDLEDVENSISLLVELCKTSW